jgi:hypothetical protein
MKNLRFGTYALMISIILWGTLLGGAVYAGLVYFPAYLSHLPESSVVVNGPYGLNESRFWIAIHPLVILSLIISIVANWREKGRRNLVLIVFAVYVVVLVVTGLYFLPELAAFRASPESALSPSEWLTRTDRWQTLNIVRAAILYACSIPLLFALLKGPEPAAQ